MRALTIAAALVAALPVLAQAQEDPGTLAVTGEGRVAVEPDMARIRLGVGAEAEEAGAAAAALAEALRPVLDGLTGAGIAPADIQTGSLQLGPVYAEAESRPGAPPEIAGYRAESLLTVTVRDIGAIGEILDAAVGDGANRLDGIAFTLSEPQATEDAALAAAVADALRKAQIASTAAGRTLGPILEIVEAQDSGPGPEMMRMSAASDMPVALGTVEATARVTVTYALGE